jgi:hypothetical protein
VAHESVQERRGRIRRGALPMDPDLARDFERWLLEAHVSELFRTLENRLWRNQDIICPAIYHRLTAEQLEQVRLRAVLLIHRDHGGRYTERLVVVCSDGQRLWTEML